MNHNVDQCAKSRHAINSTAFQRTNNRTAYVNWMLEHKQAINSWYKNPAFVRDESIAVHGPSIRKAITLEFGSGALLVLRESQAWFRERVHRFLRRAATPPSEREEALPCTWPRRVLGRRLCVPYLNRFYGR